MSYIGKLQNEIAMQGSKIEALEKKVNQIGRQGENKMKQDVIQIVVETDRNLIEMLRVQGLYVEELSNKIAMQDATIDALVKKVNQIGGHTGLGLIDDLGLDPIGR